MVVSLSRYCRVYPIPNKEAHMVAKVLMDQHFNVYGSPDPLHSDNGNENGNNLCKEMFSKFKIQHTTILLHNPSSNSVECFNQMLTVILRTRGPRVQDNCG